MFNYSLSLPHSVVDNPVGGSLFRNFVMWFSALLLLGLVASDCHETHAQQWKPAASDSKPEQAVDVSAFFTSTARGKVVLSIRARPEPGWHFYSITQEKGGPNPTRIKLKPSPLFHLRGQFSTDGEPQIVRFPELWPDLDVEQHHRTVVWSAPIDLANGTDITSIVIEGEVWIQAESSSTALMLHRPFKASLASVAPRRAEPRLRRIRAGKWMSCRRRK
jgi:hypothetical protein